MSARAEPQTVLIGTTSAGKLREFREILGELPARLVSLEDVGIDFDVEEGDESFAENAALKARAYRKASGLLTIAEDSGFVIDALDGEPGVRSARWGGTDDYAVKNRLILERLCGVTQSERGCGYVSHLAIAVPDGRIYRRSGACRGRVAAEAAGSGGFGYDPIFFVPRFRRTMAQLSPEQKHRISHRGRATRRALPLLRRLLAGDE